MIAIGGSMRGSKFWLWLVVSVALSSCNLPARDNPHDPQSDPVPRLRIGVMTATGVDYQSQDGGRQTTFVLDASQSTDPLGRPASFAFDLNDSHWDSAPTDDFEISNGSSTYATKMSLTSDMLGASSGGLGSAIREVRVRMTAGGNTAIATAQLILHNAAPVIDVGEDLIVSFDRPPVTLDACGGASSLAECTSQDPDGDGLHFTWVPPPGLTDFTVLDTAGRFARFTPPLGPQSFEFDVSVSDGLASSGGHLAVHLGTQVWASFEQPSSLYRVFPDHGSLFSTWTTATAGTATFSGGQDSVAVAADESVNVIVPGSGGPNYLVPIAVVKLDRNRNELMRWSLGPQFGSEAATVDHSSASCVVVRGSLNLSTAHAFEFLRADGAIFAHEDNAATANNGAAFVVDAPDGGCWTIGTEIGRFDANGVWSARTNLVMGDVSGAAGLDDGVLCVSGNTNANEKGIWCVPENSVGSDPADHVVDDYFYSALSPGPRPGTLVAYKFDIGEMRLVDLATATVVPITGIPRFGFVFQPTLVTARDSGALWLVDYLSQTLHRYQITRNDARETAAVPIGEVTGPGMWSYRSISIDPVTGELYAALYISQPTGFIARFPWHGRTADAVPGLVTLRSRLSADPTRGYVWYSGDPNVFVGNDVTVRSDRGRIVAQSPPLQNGEVWTIATAAPDGGAWLADHTAFNLTQERLLHVDSTMAILGAAAFPNEEILSIAVSRNGAHLCVSTHDPMSGLPAVRARRCDPASAVCDATSFDTGINVESYDEATVLSAAGNDGACWFRGPDPLSSAGIVTRVPFSAAAPDLTFAVDPANGVGPRCKRLVLDPRNEWPWTAGNSGVQLTDPSTGLPVASFSSAPSQCLDVVKRCDDANDTACVDVWTLRGIPASLYRTSGNVDTNLEVYDLPSSIPAGLEAR